MKRDIKEFSGLLLNEDYLFRDIRGTLLKIQIPDENRIESVLVSENSKAGTVRGLHFQITPFEETKIVKCVTGKVIDFLVDLRKESSTYGDWCAIQLAADIPNSILIPPGFAHGFQTLVDNSSLLYCISGKFQALSSVHLNILDPELDIVLPLPISRISDNDLAGISFSKYTEMRSE